MAAEVLGNAWHISPQGLNIITENNTIKDKKTILKNALDADLKEIGSPILTKESPKGTISDVVLQIQKIRNISAPKANENSETAPRMLKLVLTDGDSYIQAIETAPIPAINRNKTPPGSKLLIKSSKIASGYLLLDSNNCSLLGGQVAALYEKWELAKSVQFHNRLNASNDGAPAWVNFGCRVNSDTDDKQFKSLDKKNKEVKENKEFELQRQGAIAEATSGAVKKVFGGGAKQSVQEHVNSSYRKPNDGQVFKERRPQRVVKNYNGQKDDEEPQQKPPERVSLFDFLENKLPNSVEVEPVKSMANNKQSFNNNTSYIQTNQYYPQNNRRSNNAYNAPRPPYNKPETNYNSKRNESKPKPIYNQSQQSSDVNTLGNSLEKISLNSQFASRSLRQHLNLAPPKRADVAKPNANTLNVGDECMAKYWEDGKMYNATITAITDKTYAVTFKGYGNTEEVLKSDCYPAKNRDKIGKKPHSGGMEFRKSTNYKRQ